MTHDELTQCAFVVIKIRFNNTSHFLLRRNEKWNDISFVGGHAELRDGNSLRNTALRELREEVPAMRTYRKIDLIPITDAVQYGPVFSRSTGLKKTYLVKFFLAKFLDEEFELNRIITPKTRNVLVAEKDLQLAGHVRKSGYIDFLASQFSIGLAGIGFSIGKTVHSEPPDHIEPALQFG